MPTYTNRSTGQTVTATGDQAKRLDRLSQRWERTGKGTGGAEVDNADHGTPADESPSSLPAQPASGDLPDQGDPDAAVATGDDTSTPSRSTRKQTRRK